MKTAIASGVVALGLLLAGPAFSVAPTDAPLPPGHPVQAATSGSGAAVKNSASATASAGAFSSAAASSASHDSMAGMYGSPAPSGSGIGNLLQVLGALIFIIMLMLGLAWFLKNHGPKSLMGRVPVKVVGGVSLGGRERVLVIEVADQWLVIGATPNQITTLATLPRQPTPEDEPVPGKQFSIWLKQIMEKRNGQA